jgi:hypothetical protein
MVLCISSDRVSVSAKETDELLVVTIVVTTSGLTRLWQFRTRRTLWGVQKTRPRSPEFVPFISEADRDEILEELVEALDVAGHVTREVPRPLDSLPECMIRPAHAVNVPPPRRIQHDQRILRRLLAGKPTGDRLDFLGYVVQFDIT